MKNRQFFILLFIVIIWFYILYQRTETLERVDRNIDWNVANMDRYYKTEINDIKYTLDDINDNVEKVYYNME